MLRSEAQQRLVYVINYSEHGELKLLLIDRFPFIEPVSIVVPFQPAEESQTSFREVRIHSLMVDRAKTATL